MGLNRLVRSAHALRTVQDYVKLPGYYASSPVEPTRTARVCRDEQDLWHDVLGYQQPERPEFSAELA